MLHAHRIGDLGLWGPPVLGLHPTRREGDWFCRQHLGRARLPVLLSFLHVTAAGGRAWKIRAPPLMRNLIICRLIAIRNFQKICFRLRQTHDESPPFIARKHVPFLLPSLRTFTSGHAPVGCCFPVVVSIHCKFHDHRSGALPVEIQGSHKICSEFFFLSNPASTPERKGGLI